MGAPLAHIHSPLHECSLVYLNMGAPPVLIHLLGVLCCTWIWVPLQPSSTSYSLLYLNMSIPQLLSIPHWALFAVPQYVSLKSLSPTTQCSLLYLNVSVPNRLHPSLNVLCCRLPKYECLSNPLHHSLGIGLPKLKYVSLKPHNPALLQYYHYMPRIRGLDTISQQGPMFHKRAISLVTEDSYCDLLAWGLCRHIGVNVHTDLHMENSLQRDATACRFSPCHPQTEYLTAPYHNKQHVTPNGNITSALHVFQYIISWPTGFDCMSLNWCSILCVSLN